MFRKLNVWWVIITGIGSAAKLGKQVDQLFRFFVMDELVQEGLFDYLKKPRTYGQILAEFSFVDSDYTRELFDILSTDTLNVIIKDRERYRLNPDQSLPKLENLVSKTDKRIHNFRLMAKGMTKNILPRLRNEPIGFSDSFETEGRQLLTSFDGTLGSKVYTTIRNAAFALLTNEERQGLRGKKILDIGCGSGRETAEIWLHLDGDVKLTAIDPVKSMLKLARENFAENLNGIKADHPPLTKENTPVFEVASATKLPFEDNTFDAIFHSLVLHWTPDAVKAISEYIRVLKPGGLMFGTQATRPVLNPYFDIVIRTSENTHGFFWQEEFLRWHKDHNVDLEMVTPVGVFRGHKPS